MFCKLFRESVDFLCRDGTYTLIVHITTVDVWNGHVYYTAKYAGMSGNAKTLRLLLSCQVPLVQWWRVVRNSPYDPFPSYGAVIIINPHIVLLYHWIVEDVPDSSHLNHNGAIAQ